MVPAVSLRPGPRRGARPLLVQDGPLGGECTFTGCVPSKTLIEAAGRRAPFAETMAAVHGVVESIAATETDEVLAREGVEVVHGWATVRSSRQIEVGGRPFPANGT